jgi:peptide chain release factor 1
MTPALISKLQTLALRFEEIDSLLADADSAQSPAQYRKLLSERSDIEPLVVLFGQWQTTTADRAAAKEWMSDPQMRAYATQEYEAAAAQLEALELQIQLALCPQDPDDGKNCYLEIRAGTGGEESALFAADLLRMYLRYGERQGWVAQIISHNDSDLGGYREVIARIQGAGVYSRLKFESGAHRVQRVPQTEAQGRIHTSACTVAVLPEADDIGAVQINPAELRIDTFRASGAGGQHINKTDSAVRITHLPTGVVVECQDDRSQHRNKAQALAVLAARLHDAQTRAQQQQMASTRKTLVGTGDRSERIRTYNFPQSRLTDHRINLTLYKLESILEGDLDELLDALAREHQAEQLLALSASPH